VDALTVELENVSIDVKDVKKTTSELKMARTHRGVTTEAQFVNTLRTSGQLTNSTRAFEEFLESARVDAWINHGATNMDMFPEVGTAENDKSKEGIITHGTQHFVTALLENIKSSSRLYSARDGTENHFNKNKPCPFSPIYFVDSHAYEHASFGSRKPDIVCYTGKNIGGSQDIVLLGDVKGRGNGDFSEAEIGHVLHFGIKLMTEHQAHRHLLYVFLTDGYRFQFFEIRLLDSCDRWSISQSSVFTDLRGWQVRQDFISVIKITSLTRIFCRYLLGCLKPNHHC
jgi:hypothetical protein